MLVDYILFWLLLAVRRAVVVALRVTGGVNRQHLVTEQRPPALFLANELGAVSAHPIGLIILAFQASHFRLDET